MSRSIFPVVVLLILFSVTASAQQKVSPKKVSPNDRYAVFKSRAEYGVPLSNGIPVLSRLFSKSVVENSYVWDDILTSAAVVSPDGRWFLTGTCEGEISLWDFEEPEKSRPHYIDLDDMVRKSFPDLKRPTSSQVVWMSFTQDGSRFAVGNIASTSTVVQKEKKWYHLFGDDTHIEIRDYHTYSHIAIYETETGNLLQTVELPEEMSVCGMNMSSCGRYLAYYGRNRDNGMVRVFDLENNELLFEKPRPQWKITGKMVVEDGWRKRKTEDYETVYPEPVAAMVFSPDSRSLLVVMSKSGTEIWDTANGDVLSRWEDVSFGNAAAGFSPDGTRFLLAGNHLDTAGKTCSPGKVLLFDTASRRLLREWTVGTEQRQERIVSAAFSPDGTRLLTAQIFRRQTKKKDCQVERTISVWNTETGNLVKTIPCEKGFSGGTPLIAEIRPLYNNNACHLIGLWRELDFDVDISFEEMSEQMITKTDSELSWNGSGTLK